MLAYLIFILLIVILLAVYLYARGNRPSLRVLMYHKVDAAATGKLTVTTQQLQQQLTWLLKKKYTFISFSQLREIEKQKRKDRYVIITFDDAYENNLRYAVPVLQATNTKATIFVPTAFIGKTNEWDDSKEKVMTAMQLQQLPTGIIELGLHTHTHANFKRLDGEAIKKEMQQSVETMQSNHIPFVPVLAYAYGAFPKKDPAQKEMLDVFNEAGLWYALRIGNNINSLPLKNRFIIKRIDVRGTDSFFIFKMKMLLGKTRL
jgi:peptidoglycan/xylan/chitin deacetylase (PgdA/CDA1 family)